MAEPIKSNKIDKSPFGKWLDKQEISQKDVSEKAMLSKAIISRICNDPTYKPKISTIVQITKGLNKLGKPIQKDEFWF
ncbi:helix-turn-helix transcriptional regulator (plasmid) [Bacillus mycoides]|nr:helix-turn-helix transcriptional regulator [Bacillus mycoides]